MTFLLKNVLENPDLAEIIPHSKNIPCIFFCKVIGFAIIPSPGIMWKSGGIDVDNIHNLKFKV